ncbi:methanethiol S-methyltransferase [Phenylobacterium sp.]|uniref:methanethiol S-methyltransferase n=1 Tax=Phenylobacterium sp. TaxID=1871053 RepID=UPI0035649EEB
MGRLTVFIFGVASYVVALAVFVYAMGFLGGFLTPTSLDGAPQGSLAQALAIDLALLVVFSIQHSGMARPAFKRWWTRIIPAPAERSAYVLISSLAMIALFVAWRPIGGVVWETQGLARAIVIGLYVFGWALLFLATFLINHFDLFGLAQVWRQLRGLPTGAPQFHEPALYKLVRHPIYVGWLTIFWAAPTMTVAHLIFAVGTTVYILVAIQLEERDLIDEFGGTYRDYKRRTPMLIPGLGGGRARFKVGEIRAGE